MSAEVSAVGRHELENARSKYHLHTNTLGHSLTYTAESKAHN